MSDESHAMVILVASELKPEKVKVVTFTVKE